MLTKHLVSVLSFGSLHNCIGSGNYFRSVTLFVVPYYLEEITNWNMTPWVLADLVVATTMVGGGGRGDRNSTQQSLQRYRRWAKGSSMAARNTALGIQPPPPLRSGLSIRVCTPQLLLLP